MTVVARRVASIPARLATETWHRIVALVAPSDGAARAELLSVTGIAASLITRQAMQDSPIVFAGQGPQLRFYCVYGESAIAGSGVNEQALPSSPVAANAWTASLPCPAEDLAWVEESLAQLSARVTARDAEQTSWPEAGGETPSSTATIHLESFLRP